MRRAILPGGISAVVITATCGGADDRPAAATRVSAAAIRGTWTTMFTGKEKAAAEPSHLGLVVKPWTRVA